MSLRPDFCAPRLADGPLTALGGARVLLLDADNTLAPWRGAVPDPAAARWVESAKAAGFRLCIASNSDAERLRPLEEALGIPAFPRAGKPLPSGLRRIAREMGAAPGSNPWTPRGKSPGRASTASWSASSCAFSASARDLYAKITRSCPVQTAGYVVK